MKKHVLVAFALVFSLLTPVQETAASPLPNIKILATGGTIAGAATSSTQMTGYSSAELGIQVLIEAVPQMKEYATVSGEQIFKIGSQNMNNELWLTLANRINELAAQRDVNGIVITHGTDTLEETAYFLNLVVKSSKPVVLLGSMRPATAISADGPVNLLNAVRLAASEKAHGKGVLVAMNDEINGARDVTKTNTTHVSTFRAPELGYLGYINDVGPVFYRESVRKHTFKSEFSLAGITKLPHVAIIYGHAGDDRTLIDAAVSAGSKGIIYAGMGNGSISLAAEAGLVDAQKKGVVIIRSSRVGNGTVTNSIPRWDEQHFLKSDSLNPQKARILLTLALTKTSDLKDIQRMFDEY